MLFRSYLHTLHNILFAGVRVYTIQTSRRQGGVHHVVILVYNWSLSQMSFISIYHPRTENSSKTSHFPVRELNTQFLFTFVIEIHGHELLMEGWKTKDDGRDDHLPSSFFTSAERQFRTSLEMFLYGNENIHECQPNSSSTGRI